MKLANEPINSSEKFDWGHGSVEPRDYLFSRDLFPTSFLQPQELTLLATRKKELVSFIMGRRFDTETETRLTAETEGTRRQDEKRGTRGRQGNGNLKPKNK